VPLPGAPQRLTRRPREPTTLPPVKIRARLRVPTRSQTASLARGPGRRDRPVGRAPEPSARPDRPAPPGDGLVLDLERRDRLLEVLAGHHDLSPCGGRPAGVRKRKHPRGSLRPPGASHSPGTEPGASQPPLRAGRSDGKNVSRVLSPCQECSSRPGTTVDSSRIALTQDAARRCPKEQRAGHDDRLFPLRIHSRVLSMLSASSAAPCFYEGPPSPPHWAPGGDGNHPPSDLPAIPRAPPGSTLRTRNTKLTSMIKDPTRYRYGRMTTPAPNPRRPRMDTVVTTPMHGGVREIPAARTLPMNCSRPHLPGFSRRSAGAADHGSSALSESPR